MHRSNPPAPVYFFFFNDTATTEIYTLSYTTLFRSRSGVCRGSCRQRSPVGLCRTNRRRSEEHTSELQSRSDLVCRLLLEKKKDAAKRRAGSVGSWQRNFQ